MRPVSYGELVAENARLRKLVEHQRQKIDRQDITIAQFRRQLQELRDQLAELQRQNKRQAAPFSPGPPNPHPKTPGRKSGDDYGKSAFRSIPQPAQVTETHDAPLPECCSHCGSRQVQEIGTAEQYQVELPQQPIYRRFDLHIGKCLECGKRLQGRHTLQTSQALGAARSQLGPVLQSFLAVLQKQLGLAHGKCVKLLKTVWGIGLTRGGVVQSLQRIARRVAPAVQQIQESIRGSPQVAVDETGWRIGGYSAWLHVQVTERAASYVIDTSRSAEATARILGWDYAGVLVHDGFASYDNFRQARHQQCLAHLLRRCQQLLELAPKAAAVFPQAVKDWLQEALAQRDRVRDGICSGRNLNIWAWMHQERLRALLQTPKRNPNNQRLRKFLRNHLSSLVTFLKWPGIDATSWQAEQAIRPAVVNRKVWGGNRTPLGAWVQGILMTMLATQERRNASILETLTQALRQTHLSLRPAA